MGQANQSNIQNCIWLKVMTEWLKMIQNVCLNYAHTDLCIDIYRELELNVLYQNSL